MAVRAMWKGSLRLGLVSVPVRLYAASEARTRITFHQLHGDCQQRVQHKKWCAACAREVMAAELVRGYEYAKGQHVTVSDDELDTLAEASTQTVDVTSVVTERVNPVFIDTTAYVVPDGPGAVQPFETVREALGTRIAVGTVVLHQRTTLVALDPQAQGFVVYVLRGREQVRSLEDLDTPRATQQPKADVALARKLLTSLEGTLDYDAVRDEYTTRVRGMLDGKVSGKAAPVERAAARPHVSSLTDALEQSLALAANLPAKASKPAKARVLPHMRRQNGARTAAATK